MIEGLVVKMDKLWGVKPGDLLATDSMGLGDETRLHKVERVTKTLAICDLDCRFRISDGKWTGTQATRSYFARFATEADKTAVARRRTIDRIMRRTTLKKLEAMTLTYLFRVDQFLSQYTEATDAVQMP